MDAKITAINMKLIVMAGILKAVKYILLPLLIKPSLKRRSNPMADMIERER